MRKTAVVGILVGLMLAITGARLPGGSQAGEDAEGPAGFFGIVPIFDPSASDAQAMSAAGVESVRLLVYWQGAEPSPGVYDWSYYDSVFSNIASAGLSARGAVLLFADWISDNPNRPPIYSSAQIAAWQGFLTNFALRYGPKGTFWAEHPTLPYRPLRSWEIWNEANLNGFWGGPPNARDYLGLLLASRQAIRRVDPLPGSSSLGSSPSRRPGEGVNALKFMTSSTPPAARERHSTSSRCTLARLPLQMIPTCRAFRRLLDRHGSRRVAIWVTELGWGTGGHDPRTSRYLTTEPKQAAYLTRSFKALIGAQRRLRIQRVFWHTWRDVGGGQRHVLQHGPVAADGSAKPSYYAYRRLALR